MFEKMKVAMLVLSFVSLVHPAAAERARQQSGNRCILDVVDADNRRP